MTFFTKKSLLPLIIFLIILSITEGCILTNQDANNQQKSINISQPSVKPSLVEKWIRINPVGDFHTDSNFSIIGPTNLDISGTTNFPVGTTLHLDIYLEDTVREIFQIDIPVINNMSQNYFTSSYDLKGQPPGRYRVILYEPLSVTSEFTQFNIISPIPYYKSIQISPVGPVNVGKNLTISGITDMPAGEQIKIETGIFLHSCYPIRKSDRNGERTLCGGSCDGTGISQQRVRVISGHNKTNSWNATIWTSDWCPGEYYKIDATAINWTNVTSANTLIPA